MDIITQQPNIDYNFKTEDGETLAQVAVDGSGGYVKCVKTLAALEKCDCWDVPDKNGDTPVMKALKENKTEILEILVRCPRVDLCSRDKGGWSLVFRAISQKKILLVKKILSVMNKSYTGTSLAHIAVEVGEEEDIRLLVQSGTVDWTETGENEDPAILWALKTHKL